MATYLSGGRIQGILGAVAVPLSGSITSFVFDFKWTRGASDTSNSGSGSSNKIFFSSDYLGYTRSSAAGTSRQLGFMFSSGHNIGITNWGTSGEAWGQHASTMQAAGDTNYFRMILDDSADTFVWYRFTSESDRDAMTVSSHTNSVGGVAASASLGSNFDTGDDIKYFVVEASRDIGNTDWQIDDVKLWKNQETDSGDPDINLTFADATGWTNHATIGSITGGEFDVDTGHATTKAYYTIPDTPAVDEKATITDVPVGTRYEETDTRKIFRRKDDGFTVGLGDSADMASDTGNTSVATITGQTDAPTFTTKGWSASSLQAYTETDALLIENDDWTISFWMNSTSFTSMGGSKSPRLVNGRTSGDVNTSLLIEGSAGNNPPSTHILNAQIYKDPSGAVAANGSSGMVTNNWYNVVVTWTKSSGTVTFYVDYNGASSTGTVGSSTNMLLPASGGYWLLGSTAEQFVGYVTDYAFWNKVLTSSERQALYNSGAGVAANTIAKENLRVYYDCQSEPEVQKNGAAAAAWVEKGTA